MDHGGRRNSRKARLYTYLTTDIREDLLLEVELLSLAFATGVGDATTYSEYRVFTANHTGNTILLAVGAAESKSSNPPVNGIPIPLKLIAFSLTMFILGGWATGQMGNRFGRRQRWWLLLSNFFQMLLVLTAAMLQVVAIGWSSGPRKGDIDTGPLSMGAITLLAFSAGGQVALARSLHMTEITTANATSCYVDLLIDKRLFHSENRARNRRLCFLACLSAGSFVGAFTYQRLGSSRTLFISAMGKVMVTFMMFFNKGGIWIPGAFCKNNGSVIQSEESSDSGVTFTEKRCSNFGGSRDTAVLSEKPKYGEFDYQGTQTSKLLDHRGSRETSRYTLNNILDLADMHVYLQIPSWNLTTSGYRRIPKA